MLRPHLFFLIIYACLSSLPKASLAQPNTRLVYVDSGWARNSVNTVIFRKNSLFTHLESQYIGYYAPDQKMVIAKREAGKNDWEIVKTPFSGNCADAHNSISLAVDGNGFLHVAWDHHNTPLKYAVSKAPGSLELSGMKPMTGRKESTVSYPEFYSLPGGDLLFLYRDGSSGNGNLVINHYDCNDKKWVNLHENLIDGEGARNAYWQAFVDNRGTVHLSWVWRESPDVASNHDLCYARSRDGGRTWERSNGQKYVLPITAESAEYACRIPQKSELINQTSMHADEDGNPFISSYWKDAGEAVTQYQLVYHNGQNWKNLPLDFRSTPFSLSGAGTKRIPVSRPQLVVKGSGENADVHLIFRDEERNSRVSVASALCIGEPQWTLLDLTDFSVGQWEPTLDPALWKERGILHLFVQQVEQIDQEGLASTPPSPVFILEWTPDTN